MGAPGPTRYEIDGVAVTVDEYCAHLNNQHKGATATRRPKIDVNSSEQLTHNGTECRVVLRRDLIRVACTDVTPQALRHILKRYDDHFGNTGEIVLQAGE